MSNTKIARIVYGASDLLTVSSCIRAAEAGCLEVGGVTFSWEQRDGFKTWRGTTSIDGDERESWFFKSAFEHFSRVMMRCVELGVHIDAVVDGEECDAHWMKENAWDDAKQNCLAAAIVLWGISGAVLTASGSGVDDEKKHRRLRAISRKPPYGVCFIDAVEEPAFVEKDPLAEHDNHCLLQNITAEALMRCAARREEFPQQPRCGRSHPTRDERDASEKKMREELVLRLSEDAAKCATQRELTAFMRQHLGFAGDDRAANTAIRSALMSKGYSLANVDKTDKTDHRFPGIGLVA